MSVLTKNKVIIMFLAGALCLSLLLAACDGADKKPGTSDEKRTTEAMTSSAETTESSGQSESQEPSVDQTTEPGTESETTPGTESGTESETEPEPQTVSYTVSVVGSDGAPRQRAALSILKGGEKVASVTTAADGTAKVDLVPDTYEVVLNNLLGEKYDASTCILTPEDTALTIQLLALPTTGEEIYAYSESANDYMPYQAGAIAEGFTYAINVSAKDMTYYLFTASRGGEFRISTEQSLAISIGYYGSTSFVMTDSIVPEENNAIVVEVYDDMVNNYAFVIGVRTEDEALCECALKVEYESEREPTENDMPWTDLMPEKTLTQYTKGTGTVKNFAVDSAEITLVYSPADGYYHVGSEDGPVVLVNLGNNSQYMDALTTVCSNMRLGVYVYDEDGKLVSKDSYNELIWAYDAVSDNGYYPLDDTLLDMLRTVGDYMGWYDPSSPMYLFGGVALEPANAYLFACVYLQ